MDDKQDKINGIASFQQIEIDLNSFGNEPDTDNLLILPTRNLVLFPGLTLSFELARDKSKALAQQANSKRMPVGIVCQMDPDEENPSVTTGLRRYGVIADVLSIVDSPDGKPMAIVHSRNRFRILGKGANGDGFLSARVKILEDVEPENDSEYESLCGILKQKAVAISDGFPKPIAQALQSIKPGAEFINFAATNLPFDLSDKVIMLGKSKLKDRAYSLYSEINLLEQQHTLTEEITRRTQRAMSENQRNAFLQQQMETIRETLYGDEEDEIDQLICKASQAGMPEDVNKLFVKEAERLRRYNPASPDYSVLYTYLETLLAVPWTACTAPQNDFDYAEEALEQSHYGMEKVKERILEQLAMIMHNPKGKSPIICLVGAPGVGKTSIGQSIAKALGRKYQRVSFGGLHDEAEIRGHRRTYIGAMPGRIIDAMKRAGVKNPVLVLDELDKIGADYKGDPAAALLEVLDPEQNCRFHDNYLDVDYDLSDVLFIATANTLSTIARPLLDRMEIIELPGYLTEEKIAIAQRHLIPRICKDQQLSEDEFVIAPETIEAVIRRYTAESGVRALEKKLAAIGRRAVLAKMRGKEFPKPVLPEHLYDILGLAPFDPEYYEGNDYAGVVTGLAWTEVGGEILTVEASMNAAKTAGLTLTGKLGDVMKESAAIALQWVKANAAELGIDAAIFDANNIHIHFPEGAVPKDGPSAGITIATALVSLLRHTRVKPFIAMTGEITLRGKVLPVGGIREKVLAAKRAGIKEIILPQRNRRDIDDMPAQYTEGLTFNFVDNVKQVIELAVTDIEATGN